MRLLTTGRLYRIKYISGHKGITKLWSTAIDHLHDCLLYYIIESSNYYAYAFYTYDKNSL